MSYIIGIDLGTTFSASALVRDSIPEILPLGDDRIIPSVVGLTPQGNILVGTPAQNQYVLHPETTIRSIKRKMGQDVSIQLGERSYTPQEISAIILRDLKRNAEAQLGQSIERAVITVPAYFSDAARQATYEAGEIAGFTIERIINEPTAAALAYGLDRDDEHQIIAVYDLGGGTFDVSIIEMNDGVIEVRASHGNTQLGGDDFDERLVDFLVDAFQEKHEVDPREDRAAMARISRAAEAAKIKLSSQPFVKIREEYLMTHEGHPLHLEVELSRIEFEGMIRDLLEGTIESMDTAIKDAGITYKDLNRILFVGGSTRIPLVWKMITEHTGIEPDASVNPDEAVALGAAVQGAIIAGEPIEAILVDVTPHSLGIQVVSLQYGRLVPDRYSVIIPRNTTIPTSRSEVYSAVYPDQDAIELKIYQGEHNVASRNTLLGEFMFEELKSEAPGIPPRITVQFDFDVNGMLHVSAVDRGSGKQAQTSVKAAKTRLSPAEIDHTRSNLDDLEVLSLEEYKRTIEGDVIETADIAEETRALLMRARQVAHNTLNGEDNQKIQEAISNIEQAIKSADEAAIETAAEELLDLLYDMDEEE